MMLRSYGLVVVSTIVVALVFVCAITCYAGSATLTYDELNRLTRIDYGDGWSIEYQYDRYGNRTQKIVSTTDFTAPVTTPSPPGGYFNTEQQVILTCSDGMGSGCNQIYYTTDGTTPTTSSPVYSSPIDISETTTLKFFAKDWAGNSETVKTQIYTIELLFTGSITINSGDGFTGSHNVTLTLTCEGVYGCSQMQFSNDGSVYSTPEAYGTTKAWTLNSGDGIKTVYVKFKDTIGNWSSPFSDTILLDTTAPAATPSPYGCYFIESLPITLTCSDGTGTGCGNIYYTTDGTIPTTLSPVYSTPIDIWETTTLKFFAVDLPGNSEALKTELYILDACGNWPVRIGETSYTTLQAAYDAAADGDTIKCRDWSFTESLTVNRDITVTLDGGYNCDYTSNAGGQTSIKGMITTTVGGGTITIRNFVIEQ